MSVTKISSLTNEKNAAVIMWTLKEVKCIHTTLKAVNYFTLINDLG